MHVNFNVNGYKTYKRNILYFIEIYILRAISCVLYNMISNNPIEMHKIRKAFRIIILLYIIVVYVYCIL